MGVVNYLCTFIAINLAVTIVFGLNPIMLKLERWYVAISIFIGMFVPIIPAGLGHFGKDPLLGVCWIQASNDRARMRNFVLDLYLWQLLSCAIASVAVIATLVTLFMQGRATSRALFGGDSINLDLSDTSAASEPAKPQRVGLVARLFRRRRHSHHHERTFGHLEDRFIRIAIRISGYPITLIIVNGIISVADLYMSKVGGVHSRSVYGLYVLYYFLYGGRGIFFVFVSVFIDPCLMRGLRAAWEVKREARRSVRYDVEKSSKDDFPSSEAPGIQTPYATMQDGSQAQQHTLDLSGLQMSPKAHPSSLGQDSTTVASSHLPGGRPRAASDGSMDVLQALFLSGPPEDVRQTYRATEWHAGDVGDPGTVSYGGESRRGSRRLSGPIKRFLRRASKVSSNQTEAPSSEAGEKATEEGLYVDDNKTPRPTSPQSIVVALPAGPVSPQAAQFAQSFEPPTPQFTTTFAGVPADAMPDWLDDHAHDVVAPDALEAAAAVAELERVVAPLENHTAASAGSPLAKLARIDDASRKLTRVEERVGSRTPSTASGTPHLSRAASRNESTPAERRSASLASRRASLRLGPGYLRRDSLGNGPGSPLGGTHEERRQRRERAREIAEKLYEEIEAQL
ncbi:hypothetical protein Q8F55_008869 [Vanrija albida]|uniref:G-protein coupled receptors family 2 profile 2 domain-containing protein n=1 Tax=Vanrija albida TaxID=181172 RepID=A0ABR3PSZ2_9TREE